MQEKKKRGNGLDPMNMASILAFGIGSGVARAFDDWLIGVVATVVLTVLFCGIVALWQYFRAGKRKNDENFDL